jgi:serine/threonine protein kinase
MRKAKKRLFKVGDTIGEWAVEKYLGGGGNGQVYCCRKADTLGAVKVLQSIGSSRYTRFLDEIKIMEENSDLEGIIPLKEKNLPRYFDTGSRPFYVMPVAQVAENRLKGKSIDEKINAIISIGETLAILHARRISHRDIKPGNILYYESRFVLADFGLVDFPNKDDISGKNEVIGPVWTIAPEMRRESTLADGIKADVYSLAKTMWIFLTENPKGFDGQYSAESIIELKRFYPSSYTYPIDNLLQSATDNDPHKRPTIDQFIAVLKEWSVNNEDFHRRNLEQWFEIQTKLFPSSLPSRVVWENIDDIVNVLKMACKYDNLNHLFFPSSGGSDLEAVRLAPEIGFIELDFKLISLVKPKRLMFESFGYDPEWNYFRLEAEDVSPIERRQDIEDNEGGYFSFVDEYGYEDLSELSPADYHPYKILEYRSDYEESGYSFSSFSRHVSRYVRGSFVIFNKRSPYNLDSSTYDGRHSKMGADEFRAYIEKNVSWHKERFPYEAEREQIKPEE